MRGDEDKLEQYKVRSCNDASRVYILSSEAEPLRRMGVKTVGRHLPYESFVHLAISASLIRQLSRLKQQQDSVKTYGVMGNWGSAHTLVGTA